MLNYLIEKLNGIEEIDAIYFVTNQKFYPQFQRWSGETKSKNPIEVLNDGTTSDGKKLGATGDMNFVIRQKKITDDLIVVAGDNLFVLDLHKFVNFCKSNGMSIALQDVKDLELMKKYSEVKLDPTNKIISFTEKPLNPQTTLAAICLYFFPGGKLGLISKYLNEGNNPDQPGMYIQWLYKTETVHGFVFDEKWYDIGDLKQYKEADKEFKMMQNTPK